MIGKSMAYTVTLELPDKIAQNARRIAVKTDQPLDDVLIAWLEQMATELPVEELPDDQVISLSNMELDATIQAELSDLLAVNREGILTARQRLRLEELMQIYRHNLVRKAKAVKVAVDRGLRPPLNVPIG
jgi:hypothetical protein